MAKRKQNEKIADAAASEPAKIDLPQIESPSLSPAWAVNEAAPEPAAAPAKDETAESIGGPEALADAGGDSAADKTADEAAVVKAGASLFCLPHIRWTPRNKRNSVLAASVMLAAALGAVLGVLSTATFGTPSALRSVTNFEDNKAMQQSIAQLSKEVAALKTNLDAANKNATSQVAKLNDKIKERLASLAADITGSVTRPQTEPATASPAAPAVATPVPQPRPTVTAAVSRPPVVPDWTVRSARDGMAFVEGYGEIYQVVLGAQLPGLGPVQTIRRESGRWIVVTPHGIIVSMRDRRNFE